MTGKLEQVNVSSLMYTNDIAVFNCTNFDRAYTNWDITIAQHSYSTSFSFPYNSVGNTANKSLGSFLLTAEVTFANSSYIASTITITNASCLNNTNIGCNGETILLVIDSISKSYSNRHNIMHNF